MRYYSRFTMPHYYPPFNGQLLDDLWSLQFNSEDNSPKNHSHRIVFNILIISSNPLGNTIFNLYPPTATSLPIPSEGAVEVLETFFLDSSSSCGGLIVVSYSGSNLKVIFLPPFRMILRSAKGKTTVALEQRCLFSFCDRIWFSF